jgi:hypothetical protein
VQLLSSSSFYPSSLSLILHHSSVDKIRSDESGRREKRELSTSLSLGEVRYVRYTRLRCDGLHDIRFTIYDTCVHGDSELGADEIQHR